MSSENARRSQSAIALSCRRKEGEFSSQCSSKKPQKSEYANPAVIVNQASTTTIIEETVNTNSNLPSITSIQTYQ